MFSSHGPSIPHADRAILCDYKAAAKFLDERETNSHRFGKQSGWIEYLYVESYAHQDIGIRYHDTHVIVLHANGDTSFNSGGWHTVSTSNWMRSHPRFEVSLYEPRSGERKPYRYSMIRFTGHDRNIERKLREEMGMPAFRTGLYISTWSFEEYVETATGEFVMVVTNPEAHMRADEFQAEFSRRKNARHPWYVFEDGITFTRRGATDARRLDDAIAEERVEREKTRRRKLKTHGRIRAYTNRTMKALATGLPVEGEMPNGTDELRALIECGEPSGALVMRIIGRNLPGDLRDWLNLRERDGEVITGELAPIVEPIIRRTVSKTLVHTLVR